MDRQTEAIRAYYSAQNFAYWSFSGLFIPALGIVLGLIGLSRLKQLTPGNEQERADIKRTAVIAKVGVGISIFYLLITIIGGIWWFHTVTQVMEAEWESQNAVQYQEE